MLSSIIIQHLQDGERVPRDGDEIVVPTAGTSAFEGFDGSVHPSTQAAEAVNGLLRSIRNSKKDELNRNKLLLESEFRPEFSEAPPGFHP